MLNETRVIPARLRFTRPSGGSGEVLLLRPDGGDAFAFDARTWQALVRPSRRLPPGTRLEVGGAGLTIEAPTAEGQRLVRFDDGVDIAELLERAGELPLPPYVGPGDAARAARYQTVFARIPGSVAAPTASLHFTEAVLEAIEARGVEIVRLTLDVGIGTFRPMRPGPLAGHRMHAERYAIPVRSGYRRQPGARRTPPGDRGRHNRRPRSKGARRAAAGPGPGTVPAGAGETDLFIRPGFRFRVVDALLTNFHLPQSTLLVLVSAFLGYERTRAAYDAAIARNYRFFSFGDAMFAERARWRPKEGDHG